jgi:phenylpropionate dioxygenase-like ring-hydroxylating dioxygenase large terminal subunit
MKSLAIVGALAGAALALAAEAHHSAAVYYQLDKQITVEGTVTKFTLGNPHARIYLTVKGADGKPQDWMAEGGSRTVLLRKGWTGDEVKAGDVVKVVGHPSRDGSNVVHWETLVLADGKQLWGEDFPEPSSLEALRKRREPSSGE